MRGPLPAALGAAAAGVAPRFNRAVDVPPAVVNALRDACAVVRDDDEARVGAGRDWWPLSVVWALRGEAPALPAVVARPASPGEVSAVLRICSAARVPVTAVAGASGVCGGSVPVFGGVSLDMTALAGVAAVDDESLLVEVGAGTFGDELESSLRSSAGLTVGHWPQSVAISTVGGWVACRGAGQYSTRYGKIEDIVAGLEVVLADGTVIRTGAKGPRAAAGPDLTQVFTGSEGTLGVITSALLRAHPAPPAERRAAYRFESFDEGLDACRRILRRGATPAVLRLYDEAESARQFDASGSSVLVVVDEGDPAVIDAAMSVVADECAQAMGTGPADRWLEHRNELPPLESLVGAGIVADTVEVSARWSALAGVYRDAITRLSDLEGTIAASAHLSHSYTDGACLYFTFAGRSADPERYYRAAYDAVTGATLDWGGALSHHHGVGLNRGGYMRSYLGPAFDVLAALKSALDPHGILNPGKLGLPSPFGDPPAVPGPRAGGGTATAGGV
ncbi:MAG TPA: FAD-binding oxidoreductase [Acidimicrobiales bacterium]|nr:FAD-binding oxidoreductase [Acidimicrobiales bacterium]